MLEINLHVKSPLDLFLQTKGRSVGKVWGCVTKIPAGIGMFPLLIFSFAFYVVAKFLLIFLITLLYAFCCCSIFLLNFSHSPRPPFIFGCHPFFPQRKGGRGQIHLPIARLTSHIRGTPSQMLNTQPPTPTRLFFCSNCKNKCCFCC